LAAETLALPIYPRLTDDEQATVIDAVKDAVGRLVGADADRVAEAARS
jgi:dTDP-4-amino-4,6-dideoxygalactose transaminase